MLKAKTKSNCQVYILVLCKMMICVYFGVYQQINIMKQLNIIKKSETSTYTKYFDEIKQLNDIVYPIGTQN